MSKLNKSNHMQGVVFDSEESYCTVKDAILTKNKFSCDYHDPAWEDPILVVAKSQDGIKYHGCWGQPRLEDRNAVELTRFESKAKEIALIGTWKRGEDKGEGVFLFRLRKLDE